MPILSKRLVDGYFSFKKTLDIKTREQYKTLAAKGQNPEIMVVACCDSRVSPEIIFDTDPGEMVVIRNISNLIPPFCPDGSYHATSSALEYGVQRLNVNHILVLGHEDCGGIAGALSHTPSEKQNSDFIDKWLDLLEDLSLPLRENDNLKMSEKCIILEQESLSQSITNLRSYPWIAEREQKGLIKLSAAWFSIETHNLWVLNEQNGRFCKLNEDFIA